MDHLEHANVIAVDNETKSSATRTAKTGRQITYCMNVIQQPQRARACGAGAKSSADRRPVDPPPIVELKIYEGENADQEITFNMNANYFLFATLEQARHMSHGRVSEEKVQRLTVLTGTPVAGMVYLDRPVPAGYFIFPDLSVRHEGKYRLSFSLYEELKEEKDTDKRDDGPRSPTHDDVYVTHRLEVKSKPFTVFSAKKFPGLTESTSLSRMVAEQGCRVRIRRDVRMRRRESSKKAGTADWSDYEEATADSRARHSATPDPAGYPSHGFMDPIGRPRSASNTSHHSMVTPLSRRPSLQEMSQGYHPSFATAPHTPAHAYGPPPNQHYSQPPYMQQPAMHPPPPQYHAHQSYPPPPPPMSAPAPMQPTYYSGYAAQPPPAPPGPYPPPPTNYESAAPPPPRPSIDYSAQSQAEQRRSSMQYSQPSYPSSAGASAYQGYPPPPPSNYQPPPPPPPQQSSYGPKDPFAARPPPLQPVQPPARATGATTPLSARPSFDKLQTSLPPLQVPAMDASNKLEPASPSSAAPTSSYYGPSTSTDSHKRSFADSFPSTERSLNAPLRQGARPATAYDQAPSYNNHVDAEHYDGVDNEPTMLDSRYNYKRANGDMIVRNRLNYPA